MVESPSLSKELKASGSRAEYNHYERATVFFYTSESEKIKILLFSNQSTTFTTPQATFLGVDGSIVFTAARAVVEQTNGMVCDEILKAINEKRSISTKDLLFAKNLSIPELWESPQYNEFLRKFTEIKCQFDDIEGQMYYFLKINPIDTDLLNAAVKELNVTLSFKWFSTEELLQISSGYQIEKAIQQFAAIVNIPEHIKQTALYHELPLAEQNVYILLIYKKTHIEFEYFIGHLPALYLGIYRRNRETWLIFNPARDEYPSEDILKIAKGVIIPGSTASAYQDDEWLVKGRAWLKKFYESDIKTKILGICFGQQILAHTLGGKVDLIEERKTNPHYYVAWVEDVELYPELFDLKFMKKNRGIISEKIRISEFHRDEVVKLPEQFLCLGKSRSCAIEVTASKNERYFGVQGHPEFSRDYHLARRIIAFAYVIDKIELTREAFEEEFKKECGKPEEALKEIFPSRKMTYDFIKFEDE